MQGLKSISPVLCIILLCIATRLPQLLSPHLFLDGDECLVGIMAKHMYKGTGFPLHFWGQRYGFSLIECLFIIPFYAAIGINTLAVKLGMLTLWMVGVVFLYKLFTLLNTGNKLIPLVLAVVFIVNPAWAVWSMKARGGYLTAFTCSNLFLWLLFHKKYGKAIAAYIITGILLAIVYESQRFWLAYLLPFLIYRLTEERSIGKALALLTSSAACLVMLWLHKQSLHIYLETYVNMPSADNLYHRITRLPEYTYTAFQGYYYFTFIQKPDMFSIISALCFTGITAFLCIEAIRLFIVSRKANMVFIIAVLSIPAILFLTLFFADIHGRYLLPLMACVFISLQLYLNRFYKMQTFAAVASALILIGVGSMLAFKNFEFLPGRKKLITGMVQYLDKKGIRNVFSYDNMLAWELSFYSNEKIIARMPQCNGRYIPYTRQVNEAYHYGAPVALIYRHWEGEGLGFTLPALRMEMYSISFNPPYTMLKQPFCLP